MNREEAKVIKVEKDKILLKVERKAMCGCCRIAPVCNKNEGIFEIPNNNLGLTKGDRVEVGIEAQRVLGATLLIFIFPALLFVLSLVVFRQKGELLSFFLALLVVVFYYGVVKLFLRKTKKFDLNILGKIKDER